MRFCELYFCAGTPALLVNSKRRVPVPDQLVIAPTQVHAIIQIGRSLVEIGYKVVCVTQKLPFTPRRFYWDTTPSALAALPFDGGVFNRVWKFLSCHDGFSPVAVEISSAPFASDCTAPKNVWTKILSDENEFRLLVNVTGLRSVCAITTSRSRRLVSTSFKTPFLWANKESMRYSVPEIHFL